MPSAGAASNLSKDLDDDDDDDVSSGVPQIMFDIRGYPVALWEV